MAASDFARSLELVLIDEGGLDDDPNDHGGRTAHGITQSEYDAYRDRKKLPRQDVWKVSKEELTECYHEQYWEPWCDMVPAGFDYAYFDFNVNAGLAQSTRTLQSVLGVEVDGHMGQLTLSALNAADITDLIHKFCAARREFYRNLAQFPLYGRGWLARTDHVEHASLEIEAVGEATRKGLDDGTKKEATTRANPQDTAQPPVNTGTAAGTAGTAGVIAGVIDKLHQISDQLAPYQGLFKSIGYMLVAIAVVSAAFMVYGMFHDAKVQRAVA
jgi:lysozyme family protein